MDFQYSSGDDLANEVFKSLSANFESKNEETMEFVDFSSEFQLLAGPLNDLAISDQVTTAKQEPLESPDDPIFHNPFLCPVDEDQGEHKDSENANIDLEAKEESAQPSLWAGNHLNLSEEQERFQQQLQLQQQIQQQQQQQHDHQQQHQLQYQQQFQNQQYQSQHQLQNPQNSQHMQQFSHPNQFQSAQTQFVQVPLQSQHQPHFVPKQVAFQQFPQRIQPRPQPQLRPRPEPLLRPRSSSDAQSYIRPASQPQIQLRIEPKLQPKPQPQIQPKPLLPNVHLQNQQHFQPQKLQSQSQAQQFAQLYPQRTLSHDQQQLSNMVNSQALNPTSRNVQIQCSVDLSSQQQPPYDHSEPSSAVTSRGNSVKIVNGTSSLIFLEPTSELPPPPSTLSRNSRLSLSTRFNNRSKSLHGTSHDKRRSDKHSTPDFSILRSSSCERSKNRFAGQGYEIGTPHSQNSSGTRSPRTPRTPGSVRGRLTDEERKLRRNESNRLCAARARAAQKAATEFLENQVKMLQERKLFMENSTTRLREYIKALEAIASTNQNTAYHERLAL